MQPSTKRKNKLTRLRIAQRQKQRLTLIVATGSAALLTLILIIYINLSKPEEMKANESQAEQVSSLPVDLAVPTLVQQDHQPALRGINYKEERPEIDFDSIHNK
ncbi:MAG: hypothetical protein LC117_07770 [Bacteroidia bacterium]|nr:hypothetical protein [Bacteroidia bacterium]MCZ2277808.1 hypothetical protein [Bacteroidia bacterium]